MPQLTDLALHEIVQWHAVDQDDLFHTALQRRPAKADYPGKCQRVDISRVFDLSFRHVGNASY